MTTTRPGFALLLAASLGAAAIPAHAGDLPGLDPGPRLEWVQDSRGAHPAMSAPAVAVLADGTPLVAWKAVRDGGTVLEVLAAGRDGATPVRANPDDLSVDSLHQPPGIATAPDGAVLLSWTSTRERPGGAFAASDLRLSRSTDGGRSFAPPLRVNAAERPVSLGFEDIAVTGAGEPVVAWIDGAGGAAATFVARISATGDRVLGVSRVGEDTCVCCRANVAACGLRVAALWRANAPGDVRDMALARSADGGAGFAPARAVHRDGWVVPGCPHRGGSAVIEPAGRVVAAWYTEGTRGRPELRLAAAEEGRPFGEFLRLNESDGSIPDHLRIARDDGGRILAVWEESTAVRRGVVARLSTDGGRTFSPPAPLSRAMKAGDPTVAAAPGGGFAVAWTEEQFPVTRTVVLPLRPAAARTP